MGSRGLLVVALAGSGCVPGPDTGGVAVDSGDRLPLLDAATPTPAADGPSFIMDRWAVALRFGTSDDALISLPGQPAELQVMLFSGLDYPDGPELDELVSETRMCNCRVLLEGAEVQTSEEPGIFAAWQLLVDAERPLSCSGGCASGDATPLGGGVDDWFFDREWSVGLRALTDDERAAAADRYRDWDTWGPAAAGARVRHQGVDEVIHEGEQVLVLASRLDGAEVVLDDDVQPVPQELATPPALVDAAWRGIPMGMAVPLVADETPAPILAAALP